MAARERLSPTREGRWGVRQMYKGGRNGGGTVNCGWKSRDEAEEANPPFGEYTYEVFERMSEESFAIYLENLGY